MGIAVIAWQLKDRAALDYLSSLLGHDDLRVRTWVVEFVAVMHVTEAGKLNEVFPGFTMGHEHFFTILEIRTNLICA